MFADMKFIHWIRDPRDCILGDHKTDNFRKFGVEYPQTDDVYERRAISWSYQYQLMQATPKPKPVIQIRFNELILQKLTTIEAELTDVRMEPSAEIKASARSWTRKLVTFRQRSRKSDKTSPP